MPDQPPSPPDLTTSQPVADVAVIGGSGLYSLLASPTTWDISTPYGAPSDPVVVGEVGGRSVAFLPRHGADHRLPPHRIPFRANLWALAALGVRHVLAPCAVGSLRAEIRPGSIVVPDQLVDRTSGRPQTVHDGPHAVHVSFADPYCPVGRATVLATAREQGFEAVDGGTTVVVEGPRFSTRAESQSYAAQGWSLVNMTGHPEAVLARELRIGYTSVALVTDLDVGAEEGVSVTQEEVFRAFGEWFGRLQALLLAAVVALPAEPPPAAHALDGISNDLDARLAATELRVR